MKENGDGQEVHQAQKSWFGSGTNIAILGCNRQRSSCGTHAFNTLVREKWYFCSYTTKWCLLWDTFNCGLLMASRSIHSTVQRAYFFIVVHVNHIKSSGDKTYYEVSGHKNSSLYCLIRSIWRYVILLLHYWKDHSSRSPDPRLFPMGRFAFNKVNSNGEIGMSFSKLERNSGMLSFFNQKKCLWQSLKTIYWTICLHLYILNRKHCLLKS